MKGVDVSHYQAGLTIGMLRGAGLRFAVLKLTEGENYRDGSAFGFYREAYDLGFPVGGYCYSRALTAEAARREAGFMLDTVRGFPMPCGLFLDIEEPEQLALGHDALLELVRAFCERIRAAGYVPGVYGSAGTLWAKIRPEELPEGTLVWCARWGDTPPAIACDLWQTGDQGRVEGYGGPVDTDETLSGRFEALVRAPFGKRTQPQAGELRALLSALGRYLQTEEFYEGFMDFMEGREKNERAR